MNHPATCYYIIINIIAGRNGRFCMRILIHTTFYIADGLFFFYILLLIEKKHWFKIVIPQFSTTPYYLRLHHITYDYTTLLTTNYTTLLRTKFGKLDYSIRSNTPCNMDWIMLPHSSNYTEKWRNVILLTKTAIHL